jgi:ABC-type polysaccharide/polyol phosphate export permease
VTYRDFRLVVPFMMQLWFFATPVIFLQPKDPAPQPSQELLTTGDVGTGTPYSRETIDQHEEKSRARHELLLRYNPMTSLIMTFRAALLGKPELVPWGHLGVSLSVFLVLLVIGSIYFHRVEDRFADII